MRPAKRRRPAFAASAGGEAAPVAQAAGEGSEEGEGKPAAEREASLLFELAQELAPLSPRRCKLQPSLAGCLTHALCCCHSCTLHAPNCCQIMARPLLGCPYVLQPYLCSALPHPSCSGAAFDRICREFDRLIAVHEAEEELEAALKAAAHAAEPKEEPAGATGNATDIAAAAHTGGAGAGDSGDAGEGEGDEQQQQQQQQQMPAGTGGLVGGARKLVQVNAAQPQLQLQLQEAGQQQQHTPQSGMALPPAASSATAPSSAAAVVMPQHLLQMQQMIATQGLVGSMVLRPVAVPGSTAVGGAMLLQLQVPTSTAGVQQTVQQQLLQQLLRQQQLVSLAVQQQQQQRQVASGVTSGGTAAATSPALTPRAGQQERQQQQHLPADMRRSEQQQEERREHETVLPIVAPLPALRIRGQQGRQQHEQSPDELVDSLLA